MEEKSHDSMKVRDEHGYFRGQWGPTPWWLHRIFICKDCKNSTGQENKTKFSGLENVNVDLVN